MPLLTSPLGGRGHRAVSCVIDQETKAQRWKNWPKLCSKEGDVPGLSLGVSVSTPMFSPLHSADSSPAPRSGQHAAHMWAHHHMPSTPRGLQSARDPKKIGWLCHVTTRARTLWGMKQLTWLFHDTQTHFLSVTNKVSWMSIGMTMSWRYCCSDSSGQLCPTISDFLFQDNIEKSLLKADSLCSL